MKEKQKYSLDYLTGLVSENKKRKMQEVIKNRTRHITVVLEGVAQPHNASAVLRSCDIFGIQDIHIVKGKRSFVTNNDVAKGASKWLDLHYYETIETCITELKKNGYKIIATTPYEKEYTLSELAVTNKIALLFGTELHGLSEKALSLADAYVTIPMFGFTQSFNISVSTSICLYELIRKLHASPINWHLEAYEEKSVQRVWLERVLRMDHAI